MFFVTSMRKTQTKEHLDIELFVEILVELRSERLHFLLISKGASNGTAQCLDLAVDLFLFCARHTVYQEQNEGHKGEPMKRSCL